MGGGLCLDEDGRHAADDAAHGPGGRGGARPRAGPRVHRRVQLLGRRQQHHNFCVRTLLEFEPENDNECAGIVLFQNNDFHFRFIITRVNDKKVLQLIKRENSQEDRLGEVEVKNKKIYLKIEAQGKYSDFFIAEEPETWKLAAEFVDTSLLSPSVAGGFVGTYIGMYASSHGKKSSNYADFDWFEYLALE